MIEIECMCARVDRLEGVAVQLYISQYLVETSVDEEEDKTYYACKRCGSPWTQEVTDGNPILRRMENEFIV